MHVILLSLIALSNYCTQSKSSTCSGAGSTFRQQNITLLLFCGSLKLLLALERLNNTDSLTVIVSQMLI